MKLCSEHTVTVCLKKENKSNYIYTCQVLTLTVQTCGLWSSNANPVLLYLPNYKSSAGLEALKLDKTLLQSFLLAVFWLEILSL